MSRGYSIRVSNNIDELGKDTIDALSNDPFFTYGWFKTLEEQNDFKISPFYVTVYDQDKLVAFAPCFVDLLDHYVTGCLHVLPNMGKLLKIGSKLKLCNGHVLLCYSPFCHHSKILLDEPFKTPFIYFSIYQKIDEICKRERILFSSFPFVSESDVLLVKTLQNSGYIKLPWLCTPMHLDVNWPTFEEYLESLKYEVRKDVRREIRKFNQSGMVVKVHSNIGSLSEKLPELYLNIFRKYHKTGSPIFKVSFFKSLDKFAGDKIKLYTANKNGEITTFCLFLKHKDIAHAFLFGTDYSQRTKTDFAYFNLAYYEPIKWAIQDNIRKIFYDHSSESVKLNRGCKPEKTLTFVRCHSALLANLVRAYVGKKYGVQT